jgi:hypothetical protein
VKKTKLNYWVDILIGAALIVSSISGLVFLPPTVSSAFLGISYRTWDRVHTLSSLMMIAGAGLHLLLHWKWLVTMTKRMLVPSREKREKNSPAGSVALTRRRFLCLGLGAAALATIASAYAGSSDNGSEEPLSTAEALPAAEQADQTASTGAGEGAEPRASEDSTLTEVPQPTPATDPLDPTGAEPDSGGEATADEPLAVASGGDGADKGGDGEAAAETAEPDQELGVACPFGLLNDPHPGRCRRYIDRDQDGICDYSVLGSGPNRPR